MIDYIKRIPYGLRKYKLYLPDEILKKVIKSINSIKILSKIA